MNVDRKKVLDILYPMRDKLLKNAEEENRKSYQLPEDKVADRNLAAGYSRGYEGGAIAIDKAIEKVLELPNND